MSTINIGRTRIDLTNDQLDFVTQIDGEVFLHFNEVTLVLNETTYQRLTGEEEDGND